MSARLEWTGARHTTFELRRPGEEANDGQTPDDPGAWHIELGANEDGMVIEGSLNELHALLTSMLTEVSGRIANGD